MKNKKKISLALLISFLLAITLSFSLQTQLRAVGLAQASECKYTATHSTSAVLSMVRESLEDTESRRAGFSTELPYVRKSSFVISEQESLAYYFYAQNSPLDRNNLYLDLRKLLI